MTERLLAHAVDADGLAAVDELLHDAVFSMSEVTYNEHRRVVRIPFRPSRTHDLSLRRPHEVSPDVNRALTISHVSKVTTEDPEGLVEHSYSRLTARGSGLRLASNFPGQIEVAADGIDVRVTEQT